MSDGTAGEQEEIKNETTGNKSKLNEGLADNHAEMVKAIKAQTAAFEAGQIAEEQRHQVVIKRRKGDREQAVWIEACNAALSCMGCDIKTALLCGDKVLAGFKERFDS